MTNGSLTFNEYANATDRHAKYPEAGTGSDLALAYVGLGLGEAGEVQGKIKKILRGDPQAQQAGYSLQVLAEAGDVLWYIARLCREYKITMAELAQMNLDKLDDRAERGVLKGSGDNR